MLNGETRAFRPGLLGDAPGNRAAGAKARLACKEKSSSRACMTWACMTRACTTCGNHTEEPLLLPWELPPLGCHNPHTFWLWVSPGDTVNKQVRAEKLRLDICPSPAAGSQDASFCHPEAFWDFPVTQPSQHSLQ